MNIGLAIRNEMVCRGIDCCPVEECWPIGELSQHDFCDMAIEFINSTNNTEFTCSFAFRFGKGCWVTICNSINDGPNLCAFVSCSQRDFLGSHYTVSKVVDLCCPDSLDDIERLVREFLVIDGSWCWRWRRFWREMRANIVWFMLNNMHPMHPTPKSQW